MRGWNVSRAGRGYERAALGETFRAGLGGICCARVCRCRSFLVTVRERFLQRYQGFPRRGWIAQ